MINTQDIQTLMNLGEFEEAKQLCLNMLENHPNHQELIFFLAQSFSGLSDYKQSVSIFEKLIQYNPQSPDHYSNAAVELLKAKQPSKALQYLEKSLCLDPNSACTHFNLGNTYQYLNDFSNTIKHYKRAIKLNKKYNKAYSNLGAFYLKHKLQEESLQSLLKSIQLNPTCLTTHLNLSNVYRELKQEDKALSHATQAVHIASHDVEALSNYNHITLSTCQWQDKSSVWQLLDQLNTAYIDQNIPMIEPPFLNIARVANPLTNLKVAKHTCKSIQVEKIKFRAIPLPKDGEPIKVGYISGDFCNHPVGQAVVNLFSKHSKNIQAHAISYGENDQSEIRKKIKATSYNFLDISQDSDTAATSKIHDLKLHILVDLSGHTKRNRMEILATRPSRIQVSYLGYPSTTGSDFHDYLIADDIVVPSEDKSFFSEKVLHLPCYYHLVDNEHKVSNKYHSKASIGLPEDSFIFGSHCAKYKITPTIFEAWIKILKQVDNSILWLANATEYTKKNLLNTIKNGGINPDRVYFANYEMNKTDHLCRLQFADLLLDTTPYNGHTTTNDGLLAGSPVLTIQGNHFASRVSESILTRMNLDELIATDLHDYVKKAVHFANNPNQLKQLRTQISQHKSLFNMDNLILRLEELYFEIIRLEKSK